MRMHDYAPQNKLRSDGHILAVAMPTVMAAALAWWHVSSSATQASGPRKLSRIESSAGASIPPGDGFSGSANGAGVRPPVRRGGKPRWGARDELEEQGGRRIAELLAAPAAAPAGSAAHKVADFRAAYLN